MCPLALTFFGEGGCFSCRKYQQAPFLAALRFCHCPITPKTGSWVTAPACPSLPFYFRKWARQADPQLWGHSDPLSLLLLIQSTNKSCSSAQRFPTRSTAHHRHCFLPGKISNNHKLEKVAKIVQRVSYTSAQLAAMWRRDRNLAQTAMLPPWTPASPRVSLSLWPSVYHSDGQRHHLFFRHPDVSWCAFGSIWLLQKPHTEHSSSVRGNTMKSKSPLDSGLFSGADQSHVLCGTSRHFLNVGKHCGCIVLKIRSSCYMFCNLIF